MAGRPYKTNRSILLGQDNNALVFLVAINLIVFVILHFIKIIYFLSEIPIELFSKQIMDWFVLPAASETFLSRPWVILTYMFTHHTIWGLISSLLWLWSFGYILQDLTGNNKLIPVYLYGGLVGGIVFLGVVNLIPALHQQILTISPMIGAGAAVMAVAVATTTLAPDYRIFPLINGGIPLWVLMILFAVVDFSALAGSGAGAAAAHLSGGVMGYLFIRQLRLGHDWGAWMNQLLHWLNDLFNPEKESNKNHRYQQTVQKDPSNLTQQRIDQILDKINGQGYQFLTDEEKNFLKRASKEDLL